MWKRPAENVSLPLGTTTKLRQSSVVANGARSKIGGSSCERHRIFGDSFVAGVNVAVVLPWHLDWSACHFPPPYEQCSPVRTTSICFVFPVPRFVNETISFVQFHRPNTVFPGCWLAGYLHLSNDPGLEWNVFRCQQTFANRKCVCVIYIRRTHIAGISIFPERCVQLTQMAKWRMDNS